MKRIFVFTTILLISSFFYSAQASYHNFNNRYCELAEESQPGFSCVDSFDCCGFSADETFCAPSGACNIVDGASCDVTVNVPYSECAAGSVCDAGVCVPEQSACINLGGIGCTVGDPNSCCAGTCIEGTNTQCGYVDEGGLCNSTSDCDPSPAGGGTLECLPDSIGDKRCSPQSSIVPCTDAAIGACGPDVVNCPQAYECQGATLGCVLNENKCGDIEVGVCANGEGVNKCGSPANGCADDEKCLLDGSTYACVPGFEDICIGGTTPFEPGEPYWFKSKFRQIEPMDLVRTILKILFPAGLGIGLFFIVKAGWQIGASQGTPDKVKEGVKQLTAAIIGIIFLLLSVGLLDAIMNISLGGPPTSTGGCGGLPGVNCD